MTCIQKRKRGRMENLDDKKAATFSTGYQSRHHKNIKPSNPEVFVRGSATGFMVLADLAKTCLRFNHEPQTSIEKSKKKVLVSKLHNLRGWAPRPLPSSQPFRRQPRRPGGWENSEQRASMSKLIPVDGASLTVVERTKAGGKE